MRAGIACDAGPPTMASGAVPRGKSGLWVAGYEGFEGEEGSVFGNVSSDGAAVVEVEVKKKQQEKEESHFLCAELYWIWRKKREGEEKRMGGYGGR